MIQGVQDLVSNVTLKKDWCLFKNEQGKLLIKPEDFKILFRDDAIGTIMVNLAAINDGKIRSIIITGDPGTSKSWILKILDESLKRRGKLVLNSIFIDCKRISSIQSLVYFLRDNLLDKRYRSLGEIENRLTNVSTMNNKVLLLIDDLHEMSMTSPQSKLLSHLKSLKEKRISIIATSRVPVLNETDVQFWDEKIDLPRYSIDEITEILKQMIILNVVEGILVNELPLSICSRYVYENHDANLNYAIRIMELVIKKIEKDLFLGNRIKKEIKVDDVEFGVSEFEKEEKKGDIDKFLFSRKTNVILLVELLSRMKKSSFPMLYEKYTRVHNRLLPDSQVPSDRSVRDMLGAMLNAGLVKTEKTTGGGRGIGFLWVYNQKNAVSFSLRESIFTEIFDEVINDDN